MNDVTIYTTAICPYCHRAKQILEQYQLAYDEIRVDIQPHLREQMIQKSGQTTVPQIWIGDHHVGGCTDLMMLDRSQALAPLIAEQRLKMPKQ